MNIKILGSGCKKCITLEGNVNVALKDTGIAAQIEKLTNIVDIARYGVMSTPGLVIDGKLVSSGRVLSADQIAEHLSQG